MQETPTKLSSHCLLVVDDDISSLNFMKALLMLENFRVETATSYEEALALAGTANFNGFILDVNMPGTDGVGLCQELKRLYPGVPVIFCSAVAFPDRISNILNCCGEAYIVKPVNHEELLSAIRTHLSA